MLLSDSEGDLILLRERKKQTSGGRGIGRSRLPFAKFIKSSVDAQGPAIQIPPKFD